MNFFPIGDDCDPVLSAIAMCDQHVSNQQRETAQMMSTVVHMAWPEEAAALGIYKPTHAHHPCVKWLQQGFGNFNWGFEHASALYEEHEWRMGTRHASFDITVKAFQFVLRKRKASGASVFASGASILAPRPSPMPRVFNDDFRAGLGFESLEQLINGQPVYVGYRAYYRYKHRLWSHDRRAMRYTNRAMPRWLG